MKVKYILIVSLILAVLTIGAVSASEDVASDNLAVNEGVDVEEAPVDDGGLIANDGPEDEREEVDYTYDIPDEYYGGDSIDVSVYSPDVTGNITIKINNQTVYNEKVDLENDGNSYDLDLFFDSEEELPYGLYNVTIIYDGDDNYKPFTVNDAFEFTYFHVSYDDSEVIYMDSTVDFDVYYPSDANAELVITYNGKTITKKIVADEDDYEYETEVSLTDFAFGENLINFTYRDPKYPVKSVIKNLTAYPRLFIPGIIRYGNEEDVISILLPANATGNLVIYNGSYNETSYDYDWEI